MALLPFYSHTFYSGTYFGTRTEYDLLNIEAKLGDGSLIKVDVFENWLGSVLNWAEGEILELASGIVSLELQIRYLFAIDFTSRLSLMSR